MEDIIMKTIRRVIITSIISLGFSAANAFSELNLSFYDNSAFTVELDNNYYGNYSTSFCLANLSPGSHYLVVSKPAYVNNPNHGGGHGHGHGYGHGYQAKPAMMTMFSGFVNVPQNTKMFATIDNYHNFMVINQQPVCSINPVVNVHDNCHSPNYSFGMNPIVFNQLKITICNAAFDGTKFLMAKQAIVANGISSNQLVDIMRMLSFESTKLDLAKFSYGYTIDKQNYFVVNNAFDFSSSVHDLAYYIGNM
jgi:hypothetical protein